MKKRNMFLNPILVLFLVAIAHADPTAALELTVTNGMGNVVKDLIIESDGTVTSSSWVDKTPQVIAQLAESEIDSINSSISEIQEGDLIQNPHQGYNPGGFVTAYILFEQNGQAFTFARNVSGVDFTLANGQGQDLVVLLHRLAYPAPNALQ